MKRIIGLLLAVTAGVVLLYLSRFWIFDLWGRDGLFGIKELPTQGGLFSRWLRGTPLQPLELILWGVLGFMVLTWLQKGFDRLFR